MGMGSTKSYEYSICVSTCNILKAVYGSKQSNYQVFKGSLVKLYKDNNKTILSLLKRNDKLILIPSCLSCFHAVDLNLLKYLNAINDLDERLKFYKNDERRKFVLNLEKNRNIILECSGQSFKAIFEGTIEENMETLISVRLLDKPSDTLLKINKYKTLTNSDHHIMVITPNVISYKNSIDLDKKIQENLLIDKSLRECQVCFSKNLKDSKYCNLCGNSNENRDTFPKPNVLGNFPKIQDYIIEPSILSTYDNDNIFNTSEVSKRIELCQPTPKFPHEVFQPGTTEIKNVESKISSLSCSNCHIILEYDSNYCNKCGRPVVKTTACNSAYENSHDIKNTPWNCVVCCHLNDYDSNICQFCDDIKEEIDSNKSKPTSCQNYIDPNIFVSENISSNVMALNPYGTEIKNKSDYDYILHHEGDDLMEHTETVVARNDCVTKCSQCKNNLVAFQGLVLHICQHTLCASCISKIGQEPIALKHMKCLAITKNGQCGRLLTLNEIKYVLSSLQYKLLLIHLIQLNETNSFIHRCYDKNCHGYNLWEKHYEKPPTKFKCNECKLVNCLQCEAIHVGLTCKQFSKLTGGSIEKDTLDYFLNLIRLGIAMPCPKCEILIEKDEGCDWVKCASCGTEICWAIRGPRWGPAGVGDTSGGCGCTKEKKCVETCNYCH